MPQSVFEQYMLAKSEEVEQTLSSRLEREGYSAFYSWLEDFRNGLKTYADEDVPLYRRKLARARASFPSPGSFSPSWTAVWDEFDRIFEIKNETLAAIPPDKRDGEWQILLDNPYSHQQVVCYPGLGFLEAAYLYGYFRLELKPNEVLRLQKISELLTASGSREASLLPE